MYGVILGDIVSSREIASSDRQQLYEDLEAFMKELKKKKKIENYSLSRGDTLQCLVKDAGQLLRISILLRAYIKSYITGEQRAHYQTYKGKGKMALKGYFPGKNDIRLSLGIGGADFISKKNLGQSDGEAFYLSSAGLDELNKVAYKMILKTPDETINLRWETITLLLDATIDKWTNNQAEFIQLILAGSTEDVIKNRLHISQPAVSQRKKTSNWYAIEKTIEYFEHDIYKTFS